MIAAAALWLAYAVEPRHLAPILDRPYRLVVDEHRIVLGRAYRFTAERHLIFRRKGDDLVAEVTLDRLSTDAKGELARRFLIGSSGVKGMPVRIHLSPGGKPVSVDDQPAVWNAILTGLRAMAVHPPQPAALSNDPAGPLAAFPPTAQLDFIASTLDGVCIDPAALPPEGMRPVSIPTRPGPGTPARVAGTEEVSRDAQGMVHIVTRTTDAAAGLTRTRVVDAATGLLSSEVEETRVQAGSKVDVIRSTKLLTLVVP